MGSALRSTEMGKQPCLTDGDHHALAAFVSLIQNLKFSLETAQK